MLQSVFIIRSFNDTDLKENSSIQLVAASLAASLFSISNKYTWLDRDGVEEEAQEAKFSKKYPCINLWYVVRIIWRFSFVATRFCILSLIWSVLGGAVLGIFLGISFCAWCCSFVFVFNTSEEKSEYEGFAYILLPILWGISSLISTPTTSNLIYVCIHGLEMVSTLTVITIFAYSEFDCGICANAQDRQANNNPYIFMFIVAGWITMVIDFIGFGILLYWEVFVDGAWDKAFDMFFKGMEEMEKP